MKALGIVILIAFIIGILYIAAYLTSWAAVVLSVIVFAGVCGLIKMIIWLMK